MKETIRGINRFTDLTNQFFCYVNGHGDEIVFSKTMLNFEGFRTITNIREATVLVDSDCYLSYEPLDGIDIFKIGTWNHDSIYLSTGLMTAVQRLTMVLQPWYRVEPNATIAERMNLPFLKADGTLDLFKIGAMWESNRSRLEDESVQHHELYTRSNGLFLNNEGKIDIEKVKDYIVKEKHASPFYKAAVRALAQYDFDNRNKEVSKVEPQDDGKTPLKITATLFIASLFGLLLWYATNGAN